MKGDKRHKERTDESARLPQARGRSELAVTRRRGGRLPQINGHLYFLLPKGTDLSQSSAQIQSHDPFTIVLFANTLLMKNGKKKILVLCFLTHSNTKGNTLRATTS